MNNSLRAILAPAYDPCIGFSSTCNAMTWNPQAGHVPRGFCGATGDFSEVELVLVVAEPGDPHFGERHTGIDSAFDFALAAFRNGSDLFHRNVRRILDSCWPDLDFDQQMKKVWITESVLCSASRECGTVSSSIGVTCALRYLIPQIKLFDSALVVALGRKSQARLRSVGFHDFYPAFAVAPPGCNQKAAKESWARIPNELEKKMSLTKRWRQLR